MDYRRLATLLLVLLLVACGGGGATTSPGNEYGTGGDTGGDAAAPAPTSAPGASTGGLQVDRSRLSSELRFYNWADYIDPSILEDFEREYGVRVIVDVFPANEDMIAKVQQGDLGYDIVAPTDYAVKIMADDGLLAPIDKSLLPNLAQIEPQLLGKYFDPNNTYSVPYLYGTTGIAYNRERFPEGVDSWAALFEPAQIEAYRNELSMLDDERETPGAALRYLGESLNSTDPAVLARATELLKAQKPFLWGYNSTDVQRKLAAGEFVIAHAFSGDALQARKGLEEEFEGNPNIAFVIPKEGGTIWMDNLAILNGSPNAYTAHVFMNYLMSPEVAARNAEYVGFLSPNTGALPLLSEDLQALYAEGFAPNSETYQRLEWIEHNEQTGAFTDLWTELKSE